MSKVALLIGVSDYEPGLNPLPNAVGDVEAVQQVLKKSDLGGFDQVKTLINPDRMLMESEVENLFSDRTKDDLVLLFFSGHGVKDDSGKLYFATRNTRKNRKGELVRSTAVPSSFVLEVMNNSRSKRQVVILDCCYSGAFAQDMTAKDDGSIDIRSQLGAEGRAVLTSSTSTQYSFEQQGADLSVYTQYLVEGIETGAADLDNDGSISVDELHDYARQKVQEVVPAMKPEIYAAREGFRIRVSNAPVSDPKLRYYREVERVMNEGRIFLADRRWLKQLQSQLELSQMDAVTIEAAVQQRYWEYQENLEQYRQAFTEVFQNEDPLSEQSLRRFRQLQERWKLKPTDVAEIETQVTQQVRLSQGVYAEVPHQTNSTTTATAVVPVAAVATLPAPMSSQGGTPPPPANPSPDRRFSLLPLLGAVLLGGGAGYWAIASGIIQLPKPLDPPTPTISVSPLVSDKPTPPVINPTPIIPPERCYEVVGTSTLIIRGGPGTNYKQIGGLPGGQRISAVPGTSGWMQVDPSSIQSFLKVNPAPAEAWVGANYTRPCFAPPVTDSPSTDTATPTNPPANPPVTPPVVTPPVNPVSRCTVCVLYRDRWSGTAKTLAQSLSDAGLRAKAFSTDLSEVKPRSPGTVQVAYTEAGMSKVKAVTEILRSFVPEDKIVVDPQPRPGFTAGDEIQIRMF